MATEMVQAWVAHQVPGRLRLRVGSDAEAREVVGRIESSLASRAGYRGVDFRPRTRSIVVRYNAAEIDDQRLLDSWLPIAGIEALTAEAPAVAGRPGGTVVGKRISSSVGSINRGIGRATGGFFDLRDAFPLTLFAFGLRRVAQGNLQPIPWYNLLYYGYSTFFSLHGRRSAPPEPDAVELLRRRFAGGEIDEAEYRQRLAVLEGGQA